MEAGQGCADVGAIWTQRARRLIRGFLWKSHADHRPDRRARPAAPTADAERFSPRPSAISIRAADLAPISIPPTRTDRFGPKWPTAGTSGSWCSTACRRAGGLPRMRASPPAASRGAARGAWRDRAHLCADEPAGQRASAASSMTIALDHLGERYGDAPQWLGVWSENLRAQALYRSLRLREGRRIRIPRRRDARPRFHLPPHSLATASAPASAAPSGAARAAA